MLLAAPVMLRIREAFGMKPRTPTPVSCFSDSPEGDLLQCGARVALECIPPRMLHVAHPGTPSMYVCRLGFARLRPCRGPIVQHNIGTLLLYHTVSRLIILAVFLGVELVVVLCHRLGWFRVFVWGIYD
jgi:hypothetical protein